MSEVRPLRCTHLPAMMGQMASSPNEGPRALWALVARKLGLRSVDTDIGVFLAVRARLPLQAVHRLREEGSRSVRSRRSLPLAVR